MVFSVWCLVFGVLCFVFCVWCLVFGVLCFVFGVWCLVFGISDKTQNTEHYFYIPTTWIASKTP